MHFFIHFKWGVLAGNGALTIGEGVRNLDFPAIAESGHSWGSAYEVIGQRAAKYCFCRDMPLDSR